MIKSVQRIIVLLAFVDCAHSTWLLKEDRVCDPGQENFMFPYTGFRLQRQYTYGFPMLHHIRLSHCDHGVVDMESFLVTDRNTDLVWARDMCVNSQMCFRAVRNKKYARRNMSIYVPYTVVGGLFMCPGNNTECTNENARPVLPLVADRIWLQWYDYPRYRRIVQRVPYFSTPNYVDPRYPHRQDKGAQWASKLDINENYTYSTRDSYTITRVVDRILEKMNSLFTIKPGRLLWEHDPVVKDLKKDTHDALTPKLLKSVVSLLLITEPDSTIKLFLEEIEKELEPLQTINEDNIQIQHAETIEI